MTRLKHDDTGIALIVTMLMMMLIAGLMAGFYAAVNADSRSNALDKDQTRAYAAAHAGLEKMTSDLASLFSVDVSPSVAQINTIAANVPTIPGYEFRAPGGAANSGYTVTWKADVNGNPAPEDPTGSNITAGPYKGFKGIITKYPITITARSLSGGAEVRLRRELQTVAVPVFQFGVFSETDLTFYGGDPFSFGGRVHTNGNLFLCTFANSLTFTDRITAVGEVVRANLANGLTLAATGCTANVQVPVTIGTPNTYRNLASNEGSVAGMPGSLANPNWSSLSSGTYKSNIRTTLTGAKKLTLPIVTANQGAVPRDLILRAPAGEDVAKPIIFGQRFYSQASLRILLSDNPADITNLPTVTATAPIPLSAWGAPGVPVPPGYVNTTPIARSPGPAATWPTVALGPGAPYAAPGGWAANPPSESVPVNGAIPAWLKMGLLTSPTQVAPLACTGKTNTTLTGCVVSPAIPAGTVISVATTALTDGSWPTHTYTATTTAVTPNLGTTITFAAGALNLFSRGTFWVNGTAASATTPAPSALVSCTGYTDTLAPVVHEFTGCSYSGNAAPVAAPAQTITTNSLATQDAALNGGFIKIEKQSGAGAWSDVTLEILNLGFAATNIEGFICPDPTPNAVLRIQRLKDNGRPLTAAAGGYCDYASSLNPYDYWPNALYDTREGQYRSVATSGAGSGMNAGGVMNYITLDAGNLKKWLAGTTGTTGTQALNNGGYIVYFSDRRGNHNPLAVPANAETSEYGFEDVVNPTVATGLPDGLLQTGEDLNGNGTLETYGGTPATNAACADCVPAGALAPLDGATVPATNFSGNVNNRNPAMARVNKQVLFRRALKLTNGAISGGVNNLPTAGLTVVAENPVYVQGDWNATGSNTLATPVVGSSVLADAVTLLSNNWKDSLSFRYPNDPNGSRPATTTGYRFAVCAGKGLAFAWPTTAPAQSTIFGTDGGMGNFLRLLENWNINGVTINYRGSVVSLYTSRQATGTFKWGNNVYDFGTRNFAFDTNFLLPSLLPPGTPMFRDVNTLTFRQILRPTQ